MADDNVELNLSIKLADGTEDHVRLRIDGYSDPRSVATALVKLGSPDYALQIYQGMVNDVWVDGDDLDDEEYEED